MGNDELKILIEAALDLEKSFQNMVMDMNKLRERMKTYQIKVLAGLDKSASAAQIKSDLAQINKAKNRVNLVGQMDREATKKNVNSTLKKLKDSEIKITGVLDGSATASNIKKSLQSVPDVTARADVEVKGTEQVDNLRRKMDGAGDSATGMAAKLYLARTALQMLRRTVREAISTVQELDEAATSLALATGSGSDEAYKLLSKYNDMAKRLGATTTQVSDAATEWLRQGKSAAETSTLIEQSMVLSKVGAMGAEEATKSLTSTMKGFKLEVKDVAGVVDKLTAIDLKAAVTSADLATAVARTASSANLAGVGLDKLLGYITVVEETTQKSAETIGESFKTIFARMGNVKLGKFLDDDGEDLSDTEKILSSFGIALRENNDQFREFDDVLDEVAARWSDFTNVEQSAIATTIAGTRQRENFITLMENYGKSLEYTGVAADSAGTALEKFEAYESSIEAKSASFVAAMESLTMDTIDSDLVKDLIDAATARVRYQAFLRNKGENNPNFGKKMSDEQKRKLSYSHKRYFIEHDNPLKGRSRPDFSGEKHYKAHSVICLNTGEKFGTIKDAEQKCKVPQARISTCCLHKAMYGGKDENGTPLVWMYLDEYLKSSDREIENMLSLGVQRLDPISTKRFFAEGRGNVRKLPLPYYL